MIKSILATFDLQVILMLNPTKFRVNWPFGSGEEAKIDIQGDFQKEIFHYLEIWYLQVTLMLPTKFQVNWPFGSG